ncbi:MAG: IclR family transcriptional regulator [Clostridia bacterium]|nr:IclR family transcriptional regulator [Clostridia bacterium]
MLKSNYSAKYPVQTVERALDILLYLKNNPSSEGLTLNQISEGVGVGRTTVHRFLDTLLEYDMIEKSENGTLYKLGWGAFELGCDVPRYNGIDSEKISSQLKALSNYFGEIINLGIKRNNSMIIIKRFFPDMALSNYRLITNVNIGEREPLHCTGIGKLFLSEMNDNEIQEIFAYENNKQLTEFSINSADILLDEIKKVRAKGYAVDDRESSVDVFCIAVPIRDYTKKMTAGISISVPAGRITEDNIPSILSKMQETASGISRLLGYY